MLGTSPNCSHHSIMASVLWALRRLPRASRPVKRVEKREGARAPSKLSHSFSRTSTVLSKAYFATSTQKRSYTSASRGVEVAREFEDWINAIPIQQNKVRLHRPFINTHSSIYPRFDSAHARSIVSIPQVIGKGLNEMSKWRNNVRLQMLSIADFHRTQQARHHWNT